MSICILQKESLGLQIQETLAPYLLSFRSPLMQLCARFHAQNAIIIFKISRQIHINFHKSPSILNLINKRQILNLSF